MKRICTICARGGSKGVKNKNVLTVAGKPLVAHTIVQAQTSGLFDVIAVSSDSQEILDVSKEWGADILINRSNDLALDTSPKIPVIQNCVKKAEEISQISFNTCVDLDCTSPLRDVDDILACVKILEVSKCQNVITGSLARRSPYFNLVEEIDGRVQVSKQLPSGVARRQDSPKCYDMNASIYVWQRAALLENQSLFLETTKIFEMPEERSMDIDSPFDLEIVTMLLEKKYGN